MLNNHRVFGSLLLLAVVTFTAGAQSLKSAKNEMDNLNYVEAIQSYQKILQKGENPEAKINLAECYRKVNDTENAEYWYSQVVQLAEAQPIHKLYYGQMLQVNGKCEMAKEWYSQFTTEVPDDIRGGYLARACEYHEELMTKNAGVYEISLMPFNSNMDDYSPYVYKNQLIFTSDRDKGSAVKRSHMWTGNPFCELYDVEFKKNDEGTPSSFKYSKADKFSNKLNTKYHEAAVSYAEDGKTIYFTRNNYFDGKVGKSDDKKVKLKIFYGSASDNSFSNLQSLPFNSDEYSVAHPAISPDDKRLYFASDMPGGFGGMDIYMSEKEDGNRWGPPVNLGPSINTEGNEIFPYFEKNGRLYFSSDGHIGLGGLDVYFTTEKGQGDFNIPTNLGFPINTTHDDFSLVFNEDGTWGYFASDRDGGVGRDDIYGFKKLASPVEVFVFDEVTKEPIKDSEVLVALTGAKIITGEDGTSQFDMKLNQCSDFTATAETYDKNKVNACTNLPNGEKVRVEIPMSRKIDLDIEGIVFDMTNGLPATGAKVSLTNDCGKPLATPVITDATGRYNFKLDRECCYTVKAEKENYIASSVPNNCTKGLNTKTTLQANLNLTPLNGAVTSVNPGNNPSGTTATNPKVPKYNTKTGLYENPDGSPIAALDLGNGVVIKNGVMTNNGKVTKPGEVAFENGSTDGTFLVNIYYDFDEATIRQDESTAELMKLMAMMKDNPDFVVEIGSHTDARGSDGYNERLSKRRAEAVVKWLTNKGVKRNRLIAFGHGENQLTNDCKNTVKCSEKEHQYNRRTEFRIINKKVGENVTVSKPKEDPRVAPCSGCPF